MRQRSSPALRFVIAFLALSLGAACDSGGSVSGVLVEYRTNQPIGGARVEITARGWGFSDGQLVWDKAYMHTSRTANDGTFVVDVPGPPFLTGPGGTLAVTAANHQKLNGVRVSAGDNLLLQTMPHAPRGTGAAGGIARIGLTTGQKPFGWIFVENRVTLNADEADLFPLAVSHGREGSVTLAAHVDGGLRFVSRSEQEIATPSYGMFLRYLNDAPTEGYRSTITLETKQEGGTLFVRTQDRRYAKLAWEPPGAIMLGGGRIPGTDEQAGIALTFPFVFNPLPTTTLAWDPTAGAGVVKPEFAGAAAELRLDEAPWLGARTYRLTVTDEQGVTVDQAEIRLSPSSPVSARGSGPAGYRYEEITLTYGEDFLPRLRLSIHSPAAVYHTADIMPNRRFAVSREFHDWDADNNYKAMRRRLHVIER